MDLVRLERAVLERIAVVARLGQVAVCERVLVDDENPTRWQVVEVRLECCRPLCRKPEWMRRLLSREDAVSSKPPLRLSDMSLRLNAIRATLIPSHQRKPLACDPRSNPLTVPQPGFWPERTPEELIGQQPPAALMVASTRISSRELPGGFSARPGYTAASSSRRRAGW